MIVLRVKPSQFFPEREECQQGPSDFDSLDFFGQWIRRKIRVRPILPKRNMLLRTNTRGVSRILANATCSTTSLTISLVSAAARPTSHFRLLARRHRAVSELSITAWLR